MNGMIGISGMTWMAGMTCMTMPEGGGVLWISRERDDQRIFWG